MIAISLAPNFSKEDAMHALRYILTPWRLVNGKENEQLEKELSAVYGREVRTISSARWGLYLILKSLNLPENSGVAVQAFTCVSVPGPILWAGLKPLYVDIIPETLTMDPADLRKKITKNTKAVIIQHTFGMPAEMDELLKVARENNLIVIEDCAHTIGSRYDAKLLGTFGEAAVISFGRDKAISSVFGGAVIVSDSLSNKINDVMDELPSANAGWVLQQLMHPVIFELLVKPFYFFGGLGKAALVLCQKLHIISKAIAPNEKKGGRPEFPASKFPNALASLARRQLQKIDTFNKKRKEAAGYYEQKLGRISVQLPNVPAKGEVFFLRYNLLVKNAKQLCRKARALKMILGDWYEVVAPKDADLEAVGYLKGSCPIAERVATESINLPTNPGMSKKELEKVVTFINETIE